MKLTDHIVPETILSIKCVQRNLCEFAKNLHVKFVKSLRVNLFSAGFSFLEPLCATGRSITLTKERAEASRSHLGTQWLLLGIFVQKVFETNLNFRYQRE